jgi:hypothetical protein
MLVGQKEFRSPVTGKALRERSAMPVERHAFRICAGTCIWPRRAERRLPLRRHRQRIATGHSLACAAGSGSPVR